MSAWAGIESGPPTGAASTSAASNSSAPISVPGVRGEGRQTARSSRPLRREQRPIIGSLDGAGALIQRHAREFVLGSAWILLPSVAINLVATSLAFDRYRDFRGSTISIPELFGGKSASSVEDLLWYFGLVVTSLVACLVGGFVSTLVVHRQLGAPLRIRSGYRALLPRLPSLLGAWLIGHCWFPFLALILANVDTSSVAALVILGGPVVVVVATLTACAAPAIVIERLGPIAGLRRSFRMSRASFGVLFGFVVGSIGLGVMVQYGIAYLPRLVQSSGLVSFGRFGWLIEGMAGQLGRLISTPLVAVATVLVYLEVRMTMEGMDIVVEADRAFGRAS